MLRVLSLAILATLVAPSVSYAQQETDVPLIRASIESVLDMDSGRELPRLPRVTIDETSGDLTVIFAIQRPGDDDPAHVMQGAINDALSILRAAFASDDAWRIHTATVVGTYRVMGKYERGKEIAVLRGVLSAERAATFPWPSASVGDLDLFWIPGDVAHLNAVGSPAR